MAKRPTNYKEFLVHFGIDGTGIPKDWHEKIDFVLESYNEEIHWCWDAFEEEMIRQLDLRLPSWRECAPEKTTV